MTDLQSLYAGICAQPDEDTPRLALADFLDEQGGQENTFRADFIRTHVQLSREEPWSKPWRELNRRWYKLHDTANDLAAKHKLSWVAHLKGRIRAFYFERGLVGELTLFSKRFVAEGSSYFEQDPIRGVKFVKLNSSVGTVKPEVLFQCPHLARLRKLDLDGSGLKDADLAKLGASPHLKGLRWLGLGSDNSFGPTALPKLLKALPALSELDFSYNWKLGNGHLTALAKCKELARVTVLDLTSTRTNAASVTALLASGNTTGLTTLRVGSVMEMEYDVEHGYMVAPRGDPDAGLEIAAAVAASKALGNLQELDLRFRALGDDGVKVLVEGAQALPALRRLNLDGCGLTLAGATALAKSDLGQRLLYVSLAYNSHLIAHKAKLKKMFAFVNTEEDTLGYVD